uniref:Uncharacterized protein ycf23 n=1 Tax=Cryptomonas curvata TaxID=233186 RepID=A0A7S0QE85_9CRYP|mmetsp:Transcript_15239/g.32560  ORF Transcript_15239/g.32560 Transcript_15239/m.32560 type:complete len:292 (+) Transcript_15239:34-909(+)
MQSVALMIAFAQLVSVGAFAPLPMMNHRSKVIGLRCVSQGSVSPNLVLRPFQDKSALKIISGLKNFNSASVSQVVKAASAGGATHVDIACSAELVNLARSLTDLPICVSSVDPKEFVAAVEAGASMVEIGNYDGFYGEGRVFSAEEVLRLTRETRALLGDRIPLSVTVPHTLALDQQVSLAIELEAAGADIIQTEGGMPMKPSTGGLQGLIEKAAPTLAATAAIAKAVRIPTMAASGISYLTAPLALAAGAAGVGVGSAINKLNSDIAMVAAVREIKEAMQEARVRDPSRR